MNSTLTHIMFFLIGILVGLFVEAWVLLPSSKKGSDSMSKKPIKPLPKMPMAPGGVLPPPMMGPGLGAAPMSKAAPKLAPKKGKK